MSAHRDPNDDRPQHYGHYASAIVVTGLFLTGAVAALVAFLTFVLGHWWAILIALGAGGFLFSVCNDSPSRPVDDYENVMGLLR